MYVVELAVFMLICDVCIPSKYVVTPRFSFTSSVTVAPRSEYVSPILISAGLLPFIVITGGVVSVPGVVVDVACSELVEEVVELLEVAVRLSCDSSDSIRALSSVISFLFERILATLLLTVIQILLL